MIKNLQPYRFACSDEEHRRILKKVHHLSDFLKQFIHIIMSYVVTEKCVDSLQVAFPSAQ